MQELKALIEARGGTHTDCIEKDELITRATEMQQPKKARRKNKNKPPKPKVTAVITLNADGELLTCGGCGESQFPDAFSHAQLKRKRARRCASCVAVKQQNEVAKQAQHRSAHSASEEELDHSKEQQELRIVEERARRQVKEMQLFTSYGLSAYKLRTEPQR